MSSVVDIRKDSRLSQVLQTAAATTYGYAILWQNWPGRQLVPIANPALQIFGRWKFLTYQCLWIQFVTYGLMIAGRRYPRLQRVSDYLFTVLAIPIGASVVISFWGVWFTMGREAIFPSYLDAYYPPWLNHVTHTIILPINLLELYLVNHRAPSARKALTGVTGYIITYGALLLYIRYETGFFVYPFLNQLDIVGVAGFLACTVALTACYYKLGDTLRKAFHGKAGQSRESKSKKK